MEKPTPLILRIDSFKNPLSRTLIRHYVDFLFDLFIIIYTETKWGCQVETVGLSEEKGKHSKNNRYFRYTGILSC